MNSVVLTFERLEGMSSPRAITTASQNLQKMIHMYLTEPVDITLETIDSSKTGNDRTWKIRAHSYEVDVAAVTNKSTKIASSAADAYSKLGMTFNLVCGFSFPKGS